MCYKVKFSEKPVRIRGRVSFPKRGWNPSPGEEWVVEVAGENARRTVYFLSPIRRWKGALEDYLECGGTYMPKIDEEKLTVKFYEKNPFSSSAFSEAEKEFPLTPEILTRLYQDEQKEYCFRIRQRHGGKERIIHILERDVKNSFRRRKGDMVLIRGLTIFLPPDPEDIRDLERLEDYIYDPPEIKDAFRKKIESVMEEMKETLRRAVINYRGREELSHEITEILWKIIPSPFAISDLYQGWCYTCSWRGKVPDGEDLVHDEIWCKLHHEPRAEDHSCSSFVPNLGKINPFAGIMMSSLPQEMLDTIVQEAERRGMGVLPVLEHSKAAQWWGPILHWVKTVEKVD